MRILRAFLTRFTQNQAYYGSRYQLEDALLACFEREDVNEDNEMIILGRSYKRSLCSSQVNYDLDV